MITHARRFARLAPIAMLVALLVLPAGAPSAQDFIVGGSLSTSFSVDSNLGLEDEEDDFSYGNTTTVGFGATLRSEEAVANLNTSLGLRFFGGSDTAEDIDIFTPALNGGATVTFGRVTTDSRINFRLDNVAFTEFDVDGGLNSEGIDVDANARRLDFGFNQGVSYAISRRNSIVTTAGVAITRFFETDDELENSRTLSAGVSFNRQLSERTTVSLSSSFSAIDVSDFEDTSSRSFTATVGVDRTVSDQLSLSAAAGARLSRTEENVPVLSFEDGVPVISLVRETDTNLGATGSFGLTYEAPRTTLSLSLSNDLSPNSEGEIEVVTALSASLGRRLTERSSFGLQASISRRSDQGSSFNDEGGERYFLQISPGFSYQLTQNWNARLSYSFRADDDDGDRSVSNAVTLGFSRPLRILD
ncbi:MAG: hypothetical protein AAF675_05250 [Pseudomonadota bacterium]